LTAFERAVRDERDRQDAKWGEQNHPDGTGRDGNRKAMADMARELCQRLAALGVVTWYHILLEEVYEALAEDDPAKLRAELIQVAAVAQQWVEAIDRRARAELNRGDHQ
jgi:type IV pilus biogenesis protein CpaD/CtpE